MKRTTPPVATLLAVVVVTAACGGGPDAPPPEALEQFCGANFCVDYPGDWTVVDSADDFVSLSHPADPDAIMATVGQTGMRGLVEAAGMEWPQPTVEVVRSFWNLIDEGNAELATLDSLADGSVTSFGAFAGGRMWYRLLPLEDTAALGVEVRAPNSTWAEHALAITGSLRSTG